MKLNFTTERLTLSPLMLADDEFILTLVNTPGWLQFIGDRNIHTPDDARAYIRKIMGNPLFFYWVVRLTDADIPVGIITLIKRDYLESHDIGFAFLPGYARRGYAFEAARVVLTYLSEEKIFARILATTVPGNTNSIGLLTKLGLIFDKEIQYNGHPLLLFGLSI